MASLFVLSFAKETELGASVLLRVSGLGIKGLHSMGGAWILEFELGV